MSDFFRNLVEDIKDADTVIAADGTGSAEFTGTIDTGSYILNAALSGSLYGGAPNNKITAFAGESATGKTFFVLGVVMQFLKDNPEGGVVYYDTEAAVTKEMMESRGIDTRRVIIAEPDTIHCRVSQVPGHPLQTLGIAFVDLPYNIAFFVGNGKYEVRFDLIFFCPELFHGWDRDGCLFLDQFLFSFLTLLL